MSLITAYFYLLIGHAIADYALQSPWIAQAKNRHAGPPDSYDEAIHGPRQPIWIMVMTAHALIHAGAVLVITKSPYLAFWQFWTHWVIDYMKCERFYNVWFDQALHALVLLAIAFVWTYG